MKIGVIGTGSVGRTMAARLAELGHSVTVGTRDPAATTARTEPDGMGNPPFATWHAEHPDVALATFEQAARHGEIVLNATGGSGSLPALTAAGADNLRGKVLIDITARGSEMLLPIWVRLMSALGTPIFQFKIVG